MTNYVQLIFHYAMFGLLVAAPVGPIATICIQRSLTLGFLPGFLSGLGAALADGVFAAVAMFGVGAITRVLVQINVFVSTLGGIWLLYMGGKLILTYHYSKNKKIEVKPVKNGLISVFFLTLLNPITILSFIAIFSNLSQFNFLKNYLLEIIAVISVFLGSLVWWFGLSLFFSIFHARMNDSSLKLINVISGGIIISFACFCLIKLFL